MLIGTKKLVNMERYHVFRFADDRKEKPYLLNENHIATDEHGITHYQFGWHRIYPDGRTKMQGVAEFNPDNLEVQVVDLGEYYDWMKKMHPIRYKRENWESSKPKNSK